jgi:altronate hydrolase
VIQSVLKLHPDDNVLIALRDLRQGERIDLPGHSITLTTDVVAKHKLATADLAIGAPVLMYGVLVGKATAHIPRGSALNTRNIRHEALPFREKASEYHWDTPDVSRWSDRTYMGYHRDDGQVGTRNYWLVVPLVFCENRNIEILKQAFEEELGFAAPKIHRRQVTELARLYREGKLEELQNQREPERTEGMASSQLFRHVDGVKFLMHQGGCGGTRDDAQTLCGLIAGYLHHPNVAGATILSLGCQNSQISILREEITRRDPAFRKPLFIFEQQQSGSEFSMLSAATRETFFGIVAAEKLRRKPAPLSSLCIGLKCGGSDGFSGISANPTVGRVSDLVTALGGRTILSEFPELCGVEQSLIDRSATKEIGDRFIQLMHDYAARAKAVRSGFEMNPSPGNLKDGLLTDAMKSAGAARKGGTSPVTAVLDYPEYATQPGLNLLCTPGNDVECVTAQVAAGANLVLFTTGLGTPTGNPVAPVVKISTNSDLARRMHDIIDIDTGPIVSGEKTIEQAADDILESIIQVASGVVRTKAETLGQDDFIPWKRGISL